MSYLEALKNLEKPPVGSVESVETPVVANIDTLDTTPSGPSEISHTPPRP